MDAVPVPGSGSGAGPAPFLIKTYEMVDDSSTDEIVSWSSSNNSFVVWNPPEFARLLLPSYFKHNNFSSFIRQLNTYGFRKSDPEKWEFSNEDFMKDQKHLLKNIHRRKPVHSHSHPQGSSSIDPERAAFDEEIEKISREKTALEADCSRFKQHCSTAKLRLEDLTQQVVGLELRQDNVLMFLEKSIQNQTFIQHLTQKFEAMDFSAYNKKRRLPEIEHSQQVLDNSSADEQSSGNAFHQDFSNKLNLELSPAVSNINRSSLKFRSYSSLSQMAVANEGMKPWPLREGLPAVEESDDHVSCHLNLTLASSQLQLGQEARESVVKEAELTDSSFSSEVQGLAQKLPAAPTRVNDVFWEQFLTERPGSSDTDDASSQYGVNSYDPEDRKPTFSVSGNTKNMEQLTL